MQDIKGIIGAIKDIKPSQWFIWGGLFVIFMSGVTGFAGIAVVDNMRLPLIIAGGVLVFCGAAMAIVRAIMEAKDPPCLDDDDDHDPR